MFCTAPSGRCSTGAQDVSTRPGISLGLGVGPGNTVVAGGTSSRVSARHSMVSPSRRATSSRRAAVTGSSGSPSAQCTPPSTSPGAKGLRPAEYPYGSPTGVGAPTASQTVPPVRSGKTRRLPYSRCPGTPNSSQDACSSASAVRATALPTRVSATGTSKVVTVTPAPARAARSGSAGMPRSPPNSTRDPAGSTCTPGPGGGSTAGRDSNQSGTSRPGTGSIGIPTSGSPAGTASSGGPEGAIVGGAKGLSPAAGVGAAPPRRGAGRSPAAGGAAPRRSAPRRGRRRRRRRSPARPGAAAAGAAPAATAGRRPGAPTAGRRRSTGDHAGRRARRASSMSMGSRTRRCCSRSGVARLSRDLAVPSGTPVAAATSATGRSR